MTIFSVLSFAGFAAGFVFLAVEGYSRFGAIGGIVGGFLGGVSGCVIGRIPLGITSSIFTRKLRKSSSEELKKKLSEEYYVSHLIIAELAVRGEDIEQFFPFVVNLLRASSADKRMHGVRNLQIWFPRMAPEVVKISYRTPSEDFGNAVEKLALKKPDAGSIETGQAEGSN